MSHRAFWTLLVALLAAGVGATLWLHGGAIAEAFPIREPGPVPRGMPLVEPAARLKNGILLFGLLSVAVALPPLSPNTLRIALLAAALPAAAVALLLPDPDALADLLVAAGVAAPLGVAALAVLRGPRSWIAPLLQSVAVFVMAAIEIITGFTSRASIDAIGHSAAFAHATLGPAAADAPQVAAHYAALWTLGHHVVTLVIGLIWISGALAVSSWHAKFEKRRTKAPARDAGEARAP